MLVILYLCLMMMACIALFLACGTIGFYACFWFTKKIYGSLKVDCHVCFTHVVLRPDFAERVGRSRGCPAGELLEQSKLKNLTVTAKTFLDIAIDGMPVGRIVFGLFAPFRDLTPRYGEAAPLATENFRGLCAGDYFVSSGRRRLTYTGTRFRRIIPKFIAQGVWPSVVS